ncbi:MAG TPA: hypothetical protein VHL78_01445, partial [Actinomycetota bacterium]|nr:hypothetical protein [Actinomycetota bacterium]
MSGEPSLARRASAALAVGAILLSGCVAPAQTREAVPGPPSPSPSPAPVPDLEVKLQRVQGFAAGRTARPRHLRGPARGVRGTMDRLYTAAFLDPAAWGAGEYPGVLREFAPGARRQAARDLRHLTLGRAASAASAVTPGRARLRVEVLLDRRRRPVA